MTFPEAESDHFTLITVIPESLIIYQTKKAEMERTLSYFKMYSMSLLVTNNRDCVQSDIFPQSWY